MFGTFLKLAGACERLLGSSLGCLDGSCLLGGAWALLATRGWGALDGSSLNGSGSPLEGPWAGAEAIPQRLGQAELAFQVTQSRSRSLVFN